MLEQVSYGYVGSALDEEDPAANTQSGAQTLEISAADGEVVGNNEPPRVYRHLSCGAQTELPEQVIRNSQIDPWYYNSFTYCSNCQANWHQSDFVWVDTRENVHGYYKRMFREKSAGYKTLYWLTSLPGMIGWGLLFGAAIGLLAGAGPVIGGGIGVGIGFVLGFGPAKDLRMAILKAFPQIQQR